MSYEPTVWKDGDLVTSAKLNKMEQGIARYDIVECITEDITLSNATLNKTWQEIWDNNYTNAIISNDSSKQYISIKGLSKVVDSNSYNVIVAPPLGSPKIFTCDSPDSYPSYDESSESTNK